MKSNLIPKLAAASLMLMLFAGPGYSQCTQLISNGNFSSVTGTSMSSCAEFNDGYVTSWYASHGSPQIGGSAHTTPYKAYFWADATDGEGIATTVNIVQNKKYILTYWYKKSGISTTDVDHFYVKLTSASQTWTTSCSGTPIPSPGSLQVIDHITTLNSTTWQQRQVCFTANANYGQVFLHPQSNSSTVQWAEVDDVSIVELTADAGADQNTSCGGNVTIGPSCTISGASYSWSPSTGLSNPNIANPTAGPNAPTTYTLTVTGPGGCNVTDQVTVTPPSCCLTAAFTFSPLPPCAIQFTNNSSVLNGTIVGYEWNFDDGTKSTEINPIHYFENPGTYNVCLKVTSYDGNQCCVEEYCTMVTTNDPCPQCIIDPDFSWTVDCDNPCTYTFTAFIPAGTGTTRPVSGWYWDFGDGTITSGQTVTHTFSSSTTFTVCVTAIGYNSSGCCTGQECENITVSGCNVPPPHDAPSGGSNNNKEQTQGTYLKIYPNPATNSTTLEYLMVESGKVTIGLFDLQGKLVKTVLDENRESGKHNMELSAADLPAGVYICKIQVNDEFQTQKMIIIK